MSVILENKDIKLQAQQGNFNPFRQEAIVIVSYNFAAKNAHYINPKTGGPGFWDMVAEINHASIDPLLDMRHLAARKGLPIARLRGGHDGRAGLLGHGRHR